MLRLLCSGKRAAGLSKCISQLSYTSVPHAAQSAPALAHATQLTDAPQQQQTNLLGARVWALGAAVAAAACCTAHVHASEVKGDLPPPPTGDAASNTAEGTHLVPLREKQRLYFLYEKRVRELSNAEKVFEYFANEKRPDGSAYMRPQDLLASLIAVYPPDRERTVRSGSLPGEPTKGLSATPQEQQVSNFFLKHFDIDGDGFISFHEYLLIITLLSVPLKDAETAFAMLDEDDSGAIDKEEFKALTAVLKDRSRRTSGAGAGRTGFKQDPDVDDSGLMLHFFGPSGTKKLDLAAFNAFLKGLHDELDRLEFEHYDPQGTGYITGQDFAHSMVASVGLHQIHNYLRKVGDMPGVLKEARVAKDDFLTFAALWRNVHALAVATDLHYNSTGHFNKADFKRASRKITGKPLSDDQVDIIFSVFDVENDGSLAVSEFVSVIRQREGRHHSTSPAVVDEMKEMGLVQCLLNCCGL